MICVTAAVVTVGVVLTDGDARAMSGMLAPKATVDAITEQRGRFIGERVVVNDQIDAIVAPRVFLLQGDPGNRILVVSERPIENLEPAGVSDGDRVTVTGTVVPTDAVEVRNALAAAGDERPPFHDAPAIVAKHVVVAPHDGGSR